MYIRDGQLGAQLTTYFIDTSATSKCALPCSSFVQALHFTGRDVHGLPAYARGTWCKGGRDRTGHAMQHPHFVTCMSMFAAP